MSTFNASKVNWKVVAESLQAAAIEVAKGTDSPLDDMAAQFVGKALVEWLQKKLAGPIVTASFMDAEAGASEVDDLKAAAVKAGIKISPTIWALLLQFGLPYLKKLLNL